MTETESDAVEAHDDDHHDHPSDLFYLKIAGILALFTALEVGTYFVEDTAPRWLLFLSLTVLMIIKFVMVVAYFMHLKYDTRWFSYVFSAGLILAMGVYAIFFFAYDLFGLG
jgi:caa(3)-type oxidase subunit IV